MRTLNIIVASRSRIAVDSLAACLSRNHDYQVTVRIISNGHEDPLFGVTSMPDLLLLHCGPKSTELTYLAENGVRDQIPLLVCGPVNDPQAMRQAMRAGARDYLPEDTSETDLLASVARVQDEMQRARQSDAARLVVAVNGKGGSGASFIATNLAHTLVVDQQARVTLVDLDIQFGGLYRYLDLQPRVGLLQAMEAAHELDEVSAQGFTSEHASGLRLLPALSNFFTMADSISIERLESVMNAYISLNDFVIADAPARLDAVTELFLTRADHILLVTQQSLPHVQDSARELQLLKNELGIPGDRISVVVNRWTKNSEIEADDIKKALRVETLYTVPNNYKIASESINTGVPVAELAKSSPLAKGIRSLHSIVRDSEEAVAPGLLKRVMPNFLGG